MMKILYAVLLLCVCTESKWDESSELVTEEAELILDEVVKDTTQLQDERQLIEDENLDQADPAVAAPKFKVQKTGRCQRYLSEEECRAAAQINGLRFQVVTKVDAKVPPGCRFRPNPHSFVWTKNRYQRGEEPVCSHGIRAVCVCGEKEIKGKGKDFCPTFGIGNGIGGTEQRIKKYKYNIKGAGVVALTGTRCVEECRNMRLTDPTINGVTIRYSGNDGCWCERGMKDVLPVSSFKTCFFDNLEVCPKFITGDGKGSSEIKVGPGFTVEECVLECKKRMKSNPSINGITVSKNPQDGCWCEVRMTGVNTGSTKYQTCLMHFKSESIPLTNPQQSRKYNLYDCHGSGKCTADRAIDNNKMTPSVTSEGGEKPKEWTAELSTYVKIDQINVYIPEWALRNGKYKKFQVDTKLNKADSWEVCKKEHSIPKGSFNPHVVKCEKPTSAKYVRLSINDNTNLYLLEVEVKGVVLESPEQFLDGKTYAIGYTKGDNTHYYLSWKDGSSTTHNAEFQQDTRRFKLWIKKLGDDYTIGFDKDGVSCPLYWRGDSGNTKNAEFRCGQRGDQFWIASQGNGMWSIGFRQCPLYWRGDSGKIKNAEFRCGKPISDIFWIKRIISG